MKNFVKGFLTLWTILTTIWTMFSLLCCKWLLEGMVDASKNERKSPRKERVTYKSYYNHRD